MVFAAFAEKTGKRKGSGKEKRRRRRGEVLVLALTKLTFREKTISFTQEL